jgi:hypothetical protein
MNEHLDPLVLDLVEWIAQKPQPYAHVIEVWRTSCPRLTVWEDAIDRGFAARGRAHDGRAMIGLTDAGRDFLWTHRLREPGGAPSAQPRV